MASTVTRTHRCTRTVSPLLGLATLSTLGLAPLAAQAQITEYTNAAAYATAAGSQTTIDFEGIAPIGKDLNVTGGLTLSGVTFTVPQLGEFLYVVDDRSDIGYHIDGHGSLAPQGGTNPSLTAALPRGTTSVGTDIAGTFGPTDLLVTLSTGDTFLFSARDASADQSFSFLGFTAATGEISSITYAIGSNRIGATFDDFRYGSASSNPVPEASTTASFGLLLALGLGGLVLRARKRKMAQSIG